MQKLDEAKRRHILATAARLFAAGPYHEVKLDDIAAEAELGKGTIYLYFENKGDLYVSMVVDGIETLLAELQARKRPEGCSAWKAISDLIDALLRFGRRHPHLYELVRAGVDIGDPRLEAKRAEIARLCEQVIRCGIRAGELADPHPALTGQFLLSCVRVCLLYAPKDMGDTALRNHILRVLGNGIREGSAR